MQSKNLYVFLIIFLLFCLVSTTRAIDIIPAMHDTTTIEELPDTTVQKFKPYAQIAFGISQRTDHNELIDFSPMFHSAFYYHFLNKVAGKFEVGYSSANRFKSDTKQTISYRNFKLDVGFRWIIFSGKLNFYHENSLEYNHYYEPVSTIWEHRIGLNFAFGFLYDINNQFSLSLSFDKSLNTASFSTNTKINSQINTIGIKDDKFFQEVFNPASIQLMIFKRI